jgi:protein translocase SecG subunit
MEKFLIASQIVLSVLLVLVILSQEKGAGLGATFGGSNQVFRGRRGVDKVLMWATTIIAVLFVVNSLAFLLLPDSNNPLDLEVNSNPGIEMSPVEIEGDGVEGLEVTPIEVTPEA